MSMLPMMFSENLFDDLFNDAFGRNMWNVDKTLYGQERRPPDEDRRA